MKLFTSQIFSTNKKLKPTDAAFKVGRVQFLENRTYKIYVWRNFNYNEIVALKESE